MNKLLGGFKKYLTPGRHNDYNPHLLREASAVAIFTIIVTLFFVAVSSRLIFLNTDLTALVLPRVLVDYANEDRLMANFKQLVISPTLQKAAQLKADDMAEKGYFAHTSPEGHSPWYWFGQAGYDFSYAGENLAVNFDESVDVNKAWMNSPGHKANIMNGNFSEIGIATAEGMYQGKRTTFVVQLFGRPASKTFIPKVIASTTPVKAKVATVATTSKVLAESVSANEMFISVEKESAPVSEANVQYSNSIERLASSPSKILEIAYLAIALLIIISLISLIFADVRNHNPRAVWLNIGLLFVITGLLYIYTNIISTGVVVL